MSVSGLLRSKGTNTQRIARLDGLRGIAALAVAMHHSLLVVSFGDIPNIWMHSLLDSLPLEVRIVHTLLWLTNGSFAVMIFMVLSGWALAQSLHHFHLSGRALLYYLSKRFWRLYPVYAAMTLFASWWWHTGRVPVAIPHQSLWWSWWFAGPLTTTDLLKHLLFLSPGLSGVSWTMQMIVIGSLVAPFLVLLLRRTKLVDDLLIITNFLLIPWVLHQEKYFLVAAFVVGLLYTKYQKFFVSVAATSWVIYFSIFFALGLRYVIDSRLAWMIEIVGALVVVTTVLKQPHIAWLETKWVLFLGKISYSFYLWHFMVLYAMTPRILPIVGWEIGGVIANAIACIAMTVPIAYFSSVVLEKWLPSTIYRLMGRDF